MNLWDLTYKKAIVTGAAQGLSKGMAEGLMEVGAEVCILDINPKVIDVAKEFNNKGFKCHGIIANIAKEREREKAFRDAVEKLGGHLDIIVNSAGVQRRHKSEEFPLNDWNFVIDINLTAVFVFCNEWAEKGINVNALAPGYMDTEMNVALTDPNNPRFLEITNRIPSKRWGTPEDMKGPVIFLASAASDYLNGAIIPVDGGYLVK